MKAKHQLPQYMAEFIGTFFLVFFACGGIIVSQTIPDALDPLAIPLIFGGVVSIMIYATGHISGAHFNPAVTLAFWAARRFPGKRVFGYIMAQCSGAILASMVHKLILGVGEHSFGATTLSLGTGAGFALEIILSFALMFVIISVATDSRAVGELAGIAIGTTVAVCAFVGGPLTGASMNPARSLGPALLSGDLSVLWLYFLAPIIGAILGAKVYEWIRCYNEDADSEHGCC